MLDELALGCTTRTTSALERDLDGYELKHRHQISDVFKSLLYTHRAIRRFLKDMTPNDPEGVDSLALLRLQFESLFAICLMLEDAKYVDAYVQDYWRKRYVQYLLVREECSGLPASSRCYPLGEILLINAPGCGGPPKDFWRRKLLEWARVNVNAIPKPF